MVNKLKPRYMGFLLIAYIPCFLKVVSFVGNPNLVDFPRLIMLITIKIVAIHVTIYDKKMRMGTLCMVIIAILFNAKKYTIQVM